MRKLVKLIASFFYLGHSPVMPGTVGSLAGLVVYFLVKNSILLHFFSILFLFMLGVIFSAEAEKVYKRKDAEMIVIDEAFGMLFALFLVPYNIWIVLLGFILFRFFDIVKPPPAKRVEEVSGAFGVMFDDMIAAIYANIILHIIIKIIEQFGVRV